MEYFAESKKKKESCRCFKQYFLFSALIFLFCHNDYDFISSSYGGVEIEMVVVMIAKEERKQIEKRRKDGLLKWLQLT